MSPEQDLIFFNKETTPIHNIENKTFFPIESVIGVGQIKSIINKRELIAALKIFQMVKQKRNEIEFAGIINEVIGTEFHPGSNPYDQIFTFIIWESTIDIPKFSPEEIDSV